MKTVNYEFREKLNQIPGGFSYNFCYQCGACVADCPAHRFMDEFNPRDIILQSLLGMEQELIGPDSLIWNCTNCYNCYERCPQDVKPIEVIIALKNLARENNVYPKMQDMLMERVKNTGVTVQQTSLIKRRREELGLPEFQITGIEDIQKLFEK